MFKSVNDIDHKFFGIRKRAITAVLPTMSEPNHPLRLTAGSLIISPL